MAGDLPRADAAGAGAVARAVADAGLTAAARRTGAKIFFADEGPLSGGCGPRIGVRGRWVLKGGPALVDSTSPRRGEKASYYSAVCLETGKVEVMDWRATGHNHRPAPRCGGRHFHGLLTATAGATRRTTNGDLGQFPGPSGRRAKSLSDHAWLEPVLGQPRAKHGAGSAQLQSRLQC